MTKNQTNKGQTIDQNKQVILEVVKKQKPDTTQQLIKIIHEKTALRPEEISALLVELENENRINFIKKKALPPTSRVYVFFRESIWYWVVITLAIATTFTVFTIPDNASPLLYLRSTLGMIFVLFLPGYAFIRTLFPSKLPVKTSSKNMDAIERFALSFGMSIVFVPLVGLILNYTPLGIRLVPITLSLLMLTVVFGTIALIRDCKQKRIFS
jgi:hypothetical protein